MLRYLLFAVLLLLPSLASGISQPPDSLNTPILLTEFPNIPARLSSTHFDTLFFKHDMSLRNYYLENSYGQFNFLGEVDQAWITADHNYEYYGRGDYGLKEGAQELVRETLAKADSSVNFAAFDLDHDSLVSVMLLHSGIGAEDSVTNQNLIWTHTNNLDPPFVSNESIIINQYVILPERNKSNSLSSKSVWEIATGLWQMEPHYSPEFTATGLGRWCILGMGSQQEPQHFCAWCKINLGWLEPIVLGPDDVANNPFSLPPVEFSPAVYKIWTQGEQSQEYFLIENRQKTGFDAFNLPAEGLIIYHIDERKLGQTWYPGRNPVNYWPEHYPITVEESGCIYNDSLWLNLYGVPGSFELEYSINSKGGSDTNPYPGKYSVREFYGHSCPNSHNYREENTRVGIFDIMMTGDTIQASLDVDQVIPNLTLVAIRIDDREGGNGDGYINPGEYIKLYPKLGNDWGESTNSPATLSCQETCVEILEENSNFGKLVYLVEKENTSPFILRVSEEASGDSLDFTLEVVSQTTAPNWQYSSSINFKLDVVILNEVESDHENNEIAKDILLNNFPNPFNPSTTIEYTVPEESFLSLKVYDLTGMLVKTLVNQKKSPGHYSIIWRGDNELSQTIVSGVYILTLETQNKRLTRKLILLK